MPKGQNRSMTKFSTKNFIKDFSIPLFSVASVGSLYLFSLNSAIVPTYLTIHTMLEIFSITLCFMIFTFQWSIRHKITQSNLGFLSCMFLSIGLYDLVHVLSYKGMPAFISESGVEKAIYFWLAARVAQTVVFVMMAARPNAKTTPEMMAFKVGGSLVLFGVFSWAVLYHQLSLPRMFIQGQGLTPLKVNIEYFIIALSFIAGGIFYGRKLKGIDEDKNVFLANSAVLMGVAEYTLTLYTHPDDILNFFGHVLKTFSYIYIYRGILSRELIQPYDEIDGLKNELTLGVKNFRALETEYERAKKIATLGSEVGHIAHDLNNVLTVINVNAQSISRHHNDNPATVKKVDVIKSAVEKSSGFLRSLISFSKNVDMERKVVDIGDSLKDIHSLLNPLIGKNIKLNFVSESGVALWGTNSDVHQLVLNLVVNARDAIGNEAGTINVAASHRLLTEDIRTSMFHIPRGDYSTLCVTDSGSGISPEHMEKIFEPFFTTKPEGKGSGIGLATVRSIVTKNGGYLMVESRLGEGTTFTLFFSKNFCEYISKQAA